MSVPRLLHQIWLGPLPAPREWLDSWRDTNPDFDYRVWDEAAIDALGLVNRRLYDRLVRIGRYDGASDIARAEILLRHGGVYVDADSRALRPLAGAPFLESSMFVVEEKTAAAPYLLNGAFMGAEPGHPTMQAYVEALGNVKRLIPTWITTGPVLLTDVIAEHGGVEVLPPSTFFSRTLQGEPVEGPPGYGEHYWASTMARELKLTGSPYPAAKATSEGLSILVAFRDDPPGWRTRCWDFIRGHLERALPEAQICVGSDESAIFNKCIALNRAAAQAEGTIYLITDSDTWLDPAEVHAAREFVEANPNRWVKPWAIKTRLDEQTTLAVLEQGLAWDGLAPHGGSNERRHPYWASPPIVVHRDVWNSVGGMDERFDGGWGGEDAGFAFALKALYGRAKVFKTDCVHLWHPRIGVAGRDMWPGQDDPDISAALHERYRRAAARPETMRALLDEREVGR